ncbi:MAG: hypothetical protein AAFY09_13090, partial [Pseudomonadota bacterium]
LYKKALMETLTLEDIKKFFNQGEHRHSKKSTRNYERVEQIWTYVFTREGDEHVSRAFGWGIDEEPNELIRNQLRQYVENFEPI